MCCSGSCSGADRLQPETGGHDTSRMLRVSDEHKNVLYISSGFDAEGGFLEQNDENTRTYRVIRREDSIISRPG